MLSARSSAGWNAKNSDPGEGWVVFHPGNVVHDESRNRQARAGQGRPEDAGITLEQRIDAKFDDGQR